MNVDRIANMLSALKNASMAKRTVVEIPHNNQCEAIAEVLKKRGFLVGVKVFKESGQKGKMLHLELAAENDTNLLSDAKRISKPGRRVYVGAHDIRPVVGGFGVRVISTSKGIMDSKEAKKKKLGGEILCEVV